MDQVLRINHSCFNKKKMTNYISSTVEHIQTELRKVVFGQDESIEQILIALLAEGHALIEGVPGTAKTLTVKTLARIIGAGFGRIQFTPDLMPSDIDGDLHQLSPLFTVLATENPIEYEGTYPLPEAQLDRFLLKIILPYPTLEAEHDIVANWNSGFNARRLDRVDIHPLPDADAISRCRAMVREVKMEEGVQHYVVDVVRRTRAHPSVLYGASPRASVALLLCSKALAAIRGRDFTTPDDVRDIARPVLRHRLALRAEAELEGVTPDGVITDIIQGAEVPR